MRQGWKEIELSYFVNDFIVPQRDKPKKFDGDIPWCRIEDFNGVYLSDSKSNQNVSEKTIREMGLKVFPINTVIVSCSADLGKCAIIQKPLVTNQTFIGLVPSENLDSKFLYFYMMSIAKKLNEMASGATIKYLSKKKFRELVVCFPPLPEQQRIVAILDEAFAAIDQAKANAEKNLQNARELFESYLKSVFEGKSWEKKVLRDVANEFGRGKSKHRPRNWEGLYGGNYPFIQTGDVRNSDKFITEYSQTYNEVGLAQSKLWKKGTICITIAANIAETAILDFDACIPDSIIGFEVDHMKVDLNFAYYLLQYYKSELKGLGKGAAQDNINLGTFENQYFPFPPLPEQKRLVKLLDLLLNETKRFEILYKMKIGNLEELRKSILQKAFAGELKTKSVPVS